LHEFCPASGRIEIRSPGVISLFLVFIENCGRFSFPVAMGAAILYETKLAIQKITPGKDK
jgi:hypothetical protein